MSDRKRLPRDCHGVTHRFRVGDAKGYLTVGLYDDGSPGEIFIRISKMGSTMSGVLHSFAIMTSIALQRGVPLAELVEKFRHVKFEPAGITTNPAIPFADSIIDYIFHWLDITFKGGYEQGSMEEGDLPLRSMPNMPSAGTSVP